MELNFLNYITSIGYQALIFMGENPNPITNEKQRNLKQAQLLLNTLGLLQEKTAGNLTEEEQLFLNNTVVELQSKFKQIQGEEGFHD